MVRIGRMIMLVAAVGFVLGGCGGSRPDKAGGHSPRKATVLTLAVPYGDSSEVDGFRREVDRLSGGTLQVVARSRWRWGQVGYETGLIRDVMAGGADLGVAGARAWDSVGVPEFRALSAPLLIGSYSLEERVLKSQLIPPMLSGLSRRGLVGLGVLPGPLRYAFGVTRPLVTPSDYAGLRIGVQESRVNSAVMRALRATPVWVAAGALTPGLGGFDQGISSAQNLRYDRIARYLTSNVVLWPRPIVLFANRAVLARLSTAQRRILVQAARDDVSGEATLVAYNQDADLGDLCRRRLLRLVSASNSDIAALRRAVKPVYTMLERDRQTRDSITEIEAMGRAVSPQPPLRCGNPATTTAERSPLDGVWEMNTKYGDEPADPQLAPENYGHWIFVFENGRFADTQVYLNACTWGYGTFTVKGSQMAWTFTDGGGIEPTGSANKPGEFFRFGWSLYRDTLTVTAVPGAISPQNFFGKPWHRLSTAPSTRYFSRRCPPPAAALPR